MKRVFLLIATFLLTLVFVSCTNTDTPSSSESLQGGLDSSSDEDSEWGDIEFPRP